MKCPFCAEEIKEDAAICKHCGRDLSITKAIYEQLRSAFDQIAQLKSEVVRLAEAIDGAVPVSNSSRRRSHRPSRLLEIALAFFHSFFIPFALLVLAYFVIEIAYDTRPWILRVALIVISVATAVVDPNSVGRSWTWNMSVAVLLGVLSIFAMAAVNYVVNHVPIFTSNAASAKESFLYMVSVALSFVTGVILARAIRPGDNRSDDGSSSRLAVSIATAFGSGMSRVEDFEKHARLVQTYINTAMLIVTAGTALFAGLHNLLN